MGGLLAGLGVVVLVVALVAIRHPNRSGTAAGSATRTVTLPPSSSSTASSSSRPPSTSPSTPASQSSSSTGLVGALPLVVLNATSTPNLATEAGDRFKAGGWTVTSVDENYSNNILSTAAYYDPSVANAQAVADALQHQFPTIKRVLPKFSPLADGPIVVILTSDYSSS